MSQKNVPIRKLEQEKVITGTVPAVRALAAGLPPAPYSRWFSSWAKIDFALRVKGATLRSHINN